MLARTATAEVAKGKSVENFIAVELNVDDGQWIDNEWR